ncbi:MAG: T9SS type A sorting domain-containing protein [Chlorobi bacterium]|nr:T9SS type A sorting domain-containing protein [Chlorobiota bacterium]
MKKIYSIKLLKVLLALALVSFVIYGYSFGIIGLTPKTTGSGCYCHGSASANVTVSFSGPDTVTAGDTAVYILTITGGPLIRGGTDIAIGRGTIDTLPFSGLIKISGELTHRTPKMPSGNSVNFPFRYTAPQTSGRDTFYACGNSVNFDNSSAGDEWNFSPGKIIFVRSPLGIINNSSAVKFELHQNYPNPFNPVTNFEFRITEFGFVDISIYDILGKQIKTFVSGNLHAGIHEIRWDASNYPSGVYFYKLSTGDYSDTKKMILIK